MWCKIYHKWSFEPDELFLKLFYSPLEHVFYRLVSHVYNTTHLLYSIEKLLSPSLDAYFGIKPHYINDTGN